MDDLAAPDFGDIGALDLDVTAFDFGTEANANRYVLPKAPRAVPAAAVRYDRAADMAKEIGPRILAGERVDALLSGNFIFGDFIEALAVETLTPIDDLTLSTLSLGEENVVSLGNMLRHDWLGTLNIVVSAYFWAHNRQNARFIYEHLDQGDRFQLAVAGVHTKIALLRVGERKIVMHGSANLRSSRSLETVTVETNPDLYDFHLGWHDDILNHYATIRKPLRAQRLFDHLARKGA